MTRAMANIGALCVYCGSRTGDNPLHIALARDVGTALAKRGMTLVYGAGGIGLMNELADAALAAGGLGTLDELFEILTWRQIGLHDKPIILIDCDGYWAPLRNLIDHVVAEGFAGPSAGALFEVVEGVEDLFDTLSAAPAPRPSAPSERL